jgi:hypothetical protein
MQEQNTRCGAAGASIVNLPNAPQFFPSFLALALYLVPK